MKINSINAISPIDGRYSNQTSNLQDFFSEKALIKYRLKIEIEYFIRLTELKIDGLKSWKKSNNKLLRKIYTDFDLKNKGYSENDFITICEFYGGKDVTKCLL